jgi:general secretion pathway protein C
MSDSENKTSVFTSMIEKTKNIFAKRGDSTSFGQFELLSMAEWASKSLQTQSYAFYGKLLTLFICTYFLADVLAMVAGHYIPEPPTAKGGRQGALLHRGRTYEDYNAVFVRNLFNRKGIIPGDEGSGGPLDPGGAPVKTTLPIDLLGVLILHDELRSIATIQDKGASAVYPVRETEEIPGKIKIVKIEPTRVVFVNLAAGRREYVELPPDNAVNARVTVGAAKAPGIEQVNPNQFNIARTEVDKALSDFNKILTQARAIPNFENGVPAGYKLFQITPGSIYSQLGLKDGDVIAGLNGEPINDPSKAFEMLNQLKNSNHMELQVKRNGTTSTMTYDIH